MAALFSGGLIEIEDYNDLAFIVNRIFSDNTSGLAFSTSNRILNDTASGAGESAGAQRTLTANPESSAFLLVYVDDVTLTDGVDYVFDFNQPVSITFIDPLAANATLQVFDRTEHRYGWGQQASVYPVSTSDPVLADEQTLQAYLEANINNLIDKVNIMEVRTDGPSTLTRIAQGAVILASDTTLITSTINTDIIDQARNWRNFNSTAFNSVETFTRTNNWNNQLIGTMRYTWNSYDEMRHFFNTGSECRAQITMTGDPLNQGYNNWNQVAEAMGILSINHAVTFQSGTNGVQSGLGAYDLSPIYQRIFTSATPQAPVDANGDFDSYGTYDTLVIGWDARILEDTPTAGQISMDIRATLDDQDLNVTTVGTTTYSGGYLEADAYIDNSAVFSALTNPTLSVFNTFESTTTTAITNITNANPAVVTIADTSGITDGSAVTITDVVGMTDVNDLSFTATIINGTTFSIGVDSTGYVAYTSGGTLTYSTDDH